MHFFKRENRQSKPVKKKKRIKSWKWLILVLIIFSPVIYIGFTSLYEFIFISTPAKLVFSHYQIRAPEDGYITGLNVRENSRVQTNEHLVSISRTDLYKKLYLLQDRLDSLTKFKNKQKFSKPVSLSLDAEKKQSLKESDVLDGLYKEMLDYANKKIITKLQIQQVIQQYFQSKRLIKSIETSISKNHKESILEEEIVLKNQIHSIQMDLASLMPRIKNLNVIVPESGYVSKLYAKNGDFVEKGSVLMDIVSPKNIHIYAFLKPKNIGYALKGSRVLVKMPDGSYFDGKVGSQPYKVVSNEWGDQYYGRIFVEIKLDKKIPSKYKINQFPIEVLFDGA
tara:strand:+ start:3644 stop:4657 length:1014 start_codon:yes stop_codon:yes gene_type:complete